MENENESVDSNNNDGEDQDTDESLENTEEETEETSNEETEDDSDVDSLQEKNKNLFARAKKAETELKKLKSAKKDDSSTSSEEVLTRDEAFLIAGGVDTEDLEQLKIIQKGTDVSLSEAVKSPMYTAYKEQKEIKAKRKKAQLGASGGSGSSKDDINKSGLTEKEHRALWEKSN